MKYGSLWGLLLVLTGCVQDPVALDMSQPLVVEKPIKNITTFDYALACMDQLLASEMPEAILLTNQHLQNLTGEQGLPNSGKEMLIAAIAKMGRNSKKIKFIAFGSDSLDIVSIQKSHPDVAHYKSPDYFIRGGITQYDRNILRNNSGIGVAFDDVDFGYDNSRSISVLGVDLSMGEVATLAIIPGVNTSNVLSVRRTNQGKDFGARISNSGAFFDFGFDQRDGVGFAVRNLIELSAIELVGLLTGLPYQTCLGSESGQLL